jgi:non-ribosomal peptide synthetase component F
MQYIEYAAELQRSLDTPLGRSQRAYWDDRLRGAPPLMLPVDHPRDGVEARRAAVPWEDGPSEVSEAASAVPSEIRGALGTLVRLERSTAFMVLLAGFAAVLRRATGQDDLSMQSTYSLRSNPKFERMLGYVGNPLVLRIDTSGSPTARELIRRTRDVVFSAWSNSNVPVLGRTPPGLRRMNFNYIPAGHAAFETMPFGEGVTSTRLRMPSDPARAKSPHDINLWLLDGPTSTQLRILYLRELFDASTIESLLRSYTDVLGAMARAPDQPIV